MKYNRRFCEVSGRGWMNVDYQRKSVRWTTRGGTKLYKMRRRMMK